MKPARRPVRHASKHDGDQKFPKAKKYGNQTQKARNSGEPRRKFGDSPFRRERTGRPNFKSRERDFERPDRNSPGGDIVCGIHAVEELLKSNKDRVKKLFASRNSRSTHRIVSNYADEIELVSSFQLTKIAHTESHQGILAICKPLPSFDLNTLLSKNSHIIALENITDPQNLGACLRSAACFGFTGVILPKNRSAKISASAAKAAAGAIEHMDFCLAGGIASTIVNIEKQGFFTVGFDPNGPREVSELELQENKIVAIFGAESEGLKRITKERVTQVVRIDQLDSPQSLNVSASVAIGLYEIKKQLSEPPTVSD